MVITGMVLADLVVTEEELAGKVIIDISSQREGTPDPATTDSPPMHRCMACMIKVKRFVKHFNSIDKSSLNMIDSADSAIAE